MSQRLFGTAIVLALSTAIGLAQDAPKQKQVKDQAEYDLFSGVTKATDPNKKLQLLQTWKEKYPDSDFKDDRLQYFLMTYKDLNQPQKMWDTAKEILSSDPKNINALYWLTLLTESLPVTPDTLATGEKAAQGLLSAEKPPNVSDADWAKAKASTDPVAYKTLGFVAMQRKDPKKAEQNYRKVLEMTPNYAQVSYALAMAIYQQVIAQKLVDRQSEVLFHLARAASLTGTGEYSAAERKPIEDYFKKFYNTYRGSSDGMDELRAAAKAKPFPDPGFHWDSKAEVEAKKANEFAQNNPMLALWMNLKNQLKAENGEEFFKDRMHNTAVPQFRGWVISTKPARRPKEIVLGIEDKNVGEITLNLASPMPNDAEPGTEIKFEGVPTAFSKEPFMVTFDVEGKDKIEGWPEPPAPARRTPARKKR